MAVTISDGQTHIINSAVDQPYRIIYGIVDVEVGGSITTKPSSISVKVENQGRLNVNGGKISGASSAVAVQGGQFSITDGTVELPDNSSGLAIVTMQGGIADIRGGTIKARQGATRGVDGIGMDGGILAVNDGIISAASATTAGGNGISAKHANVSINNGEFTGGNAGTYGGHGILVHACKGTINGGSLTGGTGGTTPGSALAQKGGSLEITGGSFTAGPKVTFSSCSLSVQDAGTTQVSGGTFTGDWKISGTGEVKVVGKDLVYKHGRLTGLLLDRSPIDVVVQTTEEGSLSIANYPPGTS